VINRLDERHRIIVANNNNNTSTNHQPAPPPETPTTPTIRLLFALPAAHSKLSVPLLGVYLSAAASGAHEATRARAPLCGPRRAA